MQRDDVRCRQQPIERHVRRVRNVRASRARVGDGHAERRRLVGDRAADAADADEAELLAAQLHAEHVVERPAAPRAGAHHALAFAEPPRDREDQAPGEIGARVGQHVGRVGDGDAARAAGRHVDVVVADRDVGDDLQLRARGIEHRGIDRVGQQADDRVLAGDALQQLLARDRLVADVQIDIATLFEPADDFDGSLRYETDDRLEPEACELGLSVRDICRSRSDCIAPRARSDTTCRPAARSSRY